MHPPGDERERLRRGTVDPLRIVDDAQERPLRRDLGQQAQHGQPHQKSVRRRTGG
jgi:hypothetical protein